MRKIVLLQLLLLLAFLCGGCFHQEKHHIESLEKIYQEIGKFKVLEADKGTYEWHNEAKERFERLVGRKSKLEIEMYVDYFQPPEETIKKKAGDCEDLAILFVSAARYLGFKARVVIGKLKREHQSPYGLFHVWAEIFWRGKWEIVDPTLASKIPLDYFFTHPYPVEKVVITFDENTYQGPQLKELQWEEMKKRKPELQQRLFLFLVGKFEAEAKRKPTDLEIKEIEEIASILADECSRFYLSGVPDDLRKLIRPQEIKEWIEGVLPPLFLSKTAKLYKVSLYTYLNVLSVFHYYLKAL